MKPHSDCFNVKLTHTTDQEKLLGENPITTTKYENLSTGQREIKLSNFS